MSNEPRITTDCYKLQWAPKFADNKKITDTDICVLVSIFVPICVYSCVLSSAGLGAENYCFGKA
jgi:hypothetical protein